MNNDWNTLYREACLASESANLLTDAYIASEDGTYEEDLLNRVRNHLYDRFTIEIEFCGIVANIPHSITDTSNDDIPF